MNAPTAIIFDLDGVLWDSSPAHERAYREVLAEVGIDTLDYKTIAGVRTDEAMARVLAKHGVIKTKEEQAQMVAKKRALASVLLEREAKIMPGVSELIPRFSRQMRHGIATSASRPSLEIFLSRTALGPYFSAMVTGDDVERGKPDPEIYLLGAERLGTPPSMVVTVEDAVEGVRAAVAAGTYVIGFVGLSSRVALIAAGAKDTIDDFTELPRIIG